MKKKLLYFFLIAVCCIVAILLSDYYRSSPETLNATYVGRDSCIKCHQTQVDTFSGSHHDKAMDLATDETVLGDFNDRTIDHFGTTSRLFRDGDRFMINTEGPDGDLHDYQIKYVFGVTPLQQYMVEIDPPDSPKSIGAVGRTQVLRVSWDVAAKKWFYLSPPDVNEKLEPDDPLHWTGITQNWNTNCATCHSTDYHKNFDLADNNYHSTFSEIDVSCEACHGPASFHNELANRKSLFWDRNHGYGLAKLKTEKNLAQINACAPCHSRRSELQVGFQPSCNFNEYYAVQTVASPIYHTDGQIRDEDYVYGSFIQSKMYHNNIKCSDCHDPHSARLIHTGNQVCTSCHQHPTEKYDTPAHHHHAPGTPGSNCVDCHMPTVTYMAVDVRRDHSFRVPDPALSLQTGTPNACTGCHLDSSKVADRTSTQPLKQYLDWIQVAEAGDAVVSQELDRINEAMKHACDSWYDQTIDAEKTTYYRELAIGLSGNADPDASTADSPTALLKKLSTATKTPVLIRASAVAGTTAANSTSFDDAVRLLRDPNIEIVSAALLRIRNQIPVESAKLQTGQHKLNLRATFEPIVVPVAKELSDASSRIRMEAAQTIVNVPMQARDELLNAEQRKAFDAAIEDLKKSMLINNDQAMAHMALGSLNEQLGDAKAAVQNFRDAVTVDPNALYARSNLAAALERSIAAGGVTAGQFESIREQIKTLREEEYTLLARIVNRLGDRADSHQLHYSFAMSSYLQRKLDLTEKHLKIAVDLQPNDQNYLVALAAYYVQVKNKTEANNTIDRLIKLSPDNLTYRAMKQQANQ